MTEQLPPLAPDHNLAAQRVARLFVRRALPHLDALTPSDDDGLDRTATNLDRSGGRAIPDFERPPVSPRTRSDCQARAKASRSALIVSASVVGMPCGNPS